MFCSQNKVLQIIYLFRLTIWPLTNSIDLQRPRFLFKFACSVCMQQDYVLADRSNTTRVAPAPYIGHNVGPSPVQSLVREIAIVQYWSSTIRLANFIIKNVSNVFHSVKLVSHLISATIKVINLTKT